MAAPHSLSWLLLTVSFSFICNFDSCVMHAYILPPPALLNEYDKLSWQEAESYCLQTYNTHLASIHDQASFDALLELIRTSNHEQGTTYWIGLSNANGESPNDYVWSDASPFDYGSTFGQTPWALNKPNKETQDYIFLDAEYDLLWNDAYNTSVHHWICNSPQTLDSFASVLFTLNIREIDIDSIFASHRLLQQQLSISMNEFLDRDIDAANYSVTIKQCTFDVDSDETIIEYRVTKRSIAPWSNQELTWFASAENAPVLYQLIAEHLHLSWIPLETGRLQCASTDICTSNDLFVFMSSDEMQTVVQSKAAFMSIHFDTDSIEQPYDEDIHLVSTDFYVDEIDLSEVLFTTLPTEDIRVSAEEQRDRKSTNINWSAVGIAGPIAFCTFTFIACRLRPRKRTRRRRQNAPHSAVKNNVELSPMPLASNASSMSHISLMTGSASRRSKISTVSQVDLDSEGSTIGEVDTDEDMDDDEKQMVVHVVEEYDDDEDMFTDHEMEAMYFHHALHDGINRETVSTLIDAHHDDNTSKGEAGHVVHENFGNVVQT